MNQRRGGFALLAAVAYLAIASTFVSAYLYDVRRAIDHERTTDRDIVCRHLADAGIDLALAELRANNAYSGVDITLGDGIVSVMVTIEDGAFLMSSVGRLMDGPVEIHRVERKARLRLGPDGAVRELLYEAP